MARHTGNTKAPFRDAIDKPNLDRPQNGDTKVKKAKRRQPKQKLTPEERQELLEKEVAELSDVEFSPTKRACRTKRGAENKLIEGSSGAKQALPKKQKGPSNGRKQTGSADQENIHSIHIPLPQVEQDPVDPWILPLFENTLGRSDRMAPPRTWDY